MEKDVLWLLQNSNDGIPDDTQFDFLHKGIIDSFDFVNTVSVLEDHFGIVIPSEEIVSENYGSIAEMNTLGQKCKRK